MVHKDFDGDGDLDLVISGDGDFRAMLVEQTARGVFHQSVLAGSEGYGQAGVTSADFDKDGRLEVALSSFENQTVGVWTLSKKAEPVTPAPKDTIAPVVTLDVPGKKAAKKASSWKKLKGTVKDEGAGASGAKDVRAKVVVKTEAGDWLYLDGKKWKSSGAKSKKKAFKKADVRKDATVAKGAWKIKAKKPALGRVYVRYWATDVAGNVAKKQTVKQVVTKK